VVEKLWHAGVVNATAIAATPPLHVGCPLTNRSRRRRAAHRNGSRSQARSPEWYHVHVTVLTRCPAVPRQEAR